MRSRIPRATLAIAASAALAAGISQAADSSDAGAKVYAEQCASCHDATGAGIAGFGSPLAGPAAARLKAPGGRPYLAQVVVHGIAGVFELDGQRQFAAMPPPVELTDEQLAAALNYVLRAQNAKALPPDFMPITPAEIAAARAVARSQKDLHRTKLELEKAAK
jgi:mono/diheme cytochrome c family protein